MDGRAVPLSPGSSSLELRQGDSGLQVTDLIDNRSLTPPVGLLALLLGLLLLTSATHASEWLVALLQIASGAPRRRPARVLRIAPLSSRRMSLTRR